MNLLEMVQEIALEFDYEEPSTVVGNTDIEVKRVYNMVNKAYNHVWTKLGKQNEYAETTSTIATAQGTESYDIPATILGVYQLRVLNDPPIRILPWPEYERIKSDIDVIATNGYPNMAAIYGRQVYFHPTPDQAYTVDVYGSAKFTELSSDAGEPSLADDFHRVVVEFAKYFLMVYENNPAVSLQLNTANEAFANVKNNIRPHYTEAPAIVPEDYLRRLDYERFIIEY